MTHNAPVGALACHCIELSLKAVLLARGYTAEKVINFGHKLGKLFKETRQVGLDWSDLDTEAIVFYGRAMLDHAFRYRNSARPMPSTTNTCSNSWKPFFIGVCKRLHRRHSGRSDPDHVTRTHVEQDIGCANSRAKSHQDPRPEGRGHLCARVQDRRRPGQVKIVEKKRNAQALQSAAMN
jgi:hypothetical protein